MGTEAKKVMVGMSPGDVPLTFANTSHAYARLGYDPQVASRPLTLTPTLSLTLTLTLTRSLTLTLTRSPRGSGPTRSCSPSKRTSGCRTTARSRASLTPTLTQTLAQTPTPTPNLPPTFTQPAS